MSAEISAQNGLVAKKENKIFMGSISRALSFKQLKIYMFRSLDHGFVSKFLYPRPGLLKAGY